MKRRPPRSTRCPYTTRFRSRYAPPATLKQSARAAFPPPDPVRCRAPPAALPHSYPRMRAEPLHWQARKPARSQRQPRSEEHTSELQSRQYLVCRLLLATNNPPGDKLRILSSYLAFLFYALYLTLDALFLGLLSFAPLPLLVRAGLSLFIAPLLLPFLAL